MFASVSVFDHMLLKPKQPPTFLSKCSEKEDVLYICNYAEIMLITVVNIYCLVFYKQATTSWINPPFKKMLIVNSLMSYKASEPEAGRERRRRKGLAEKAVRTAGQHCQQVVNTVVASCLPTHHSANKYLSVMNIYSEDVYECRLCLRMS